jgi:uncharacterized UBP type Zn finger protein
MPLNNKQLNIDKPTVTSTPSSARTAKTAHRLAVDETTDLLAKTRVSSSPAMATNGNHNHETATPNSNIKGENAVAMKNVEKNSPEKANVPKSEKKSPPKNHDNDQDKREPITVSAVVPLAHCPHLIEVNLPFTNDMVDVKAPCLKCSNTKENWVCLTCYSSLCSRYVNGHMAEHFDQTRHSMCMSYSDMSVWCYTCDSYLSNGMLDDIIKIARESKFGPSSSETTENLDDSTDTIEEPTAAEPLPYCPHFPESSTREPANTMLKAACDNCGNKKFEENWLCLNCLSTVCCADKGVVDGHRRAHFSEHGILHGTFLNTTNMIVWCYVCKAYVSNEMLSADLIMKLFM